MDHQERILDDQPIVSTPHKWRVPRGKASNKLLEEMKIDGPTRTEILRVTQINLQLSKCASDNLQVFLQKKGIDVELIQDP